MSTTQLRSDIARKSSPQKMPSPRQEIPGLNSTKTTVLHRRIALFVSIVLILVCLVAYRYAAIGGPSQPAFAVIFTVLTIFAALLTADLLLGQFLSTRLPSLAILGGIYLYVSLINIPYLLTLPKAFWPYGVFNAGLYAPSWLWIFWQIGYSCGIFAYVLIEKRYTTVQLSQQATKRVFFFLVLTIFFLVLIFSAIAIDPYHLLPNIVNRNPPPVFIPFVSAFVFGANGLMCVSAFFLLRSHNVLHLWLRVSVLASFMNVSLSLYAGGRYSIGWYVSRVDGLMTAIFVLYALFHEINKMYMWLALQNEKLAMQNRIQSDFLSVVGHEFRTALTGILGFSEMIREGDLNSDEAQEYADDIHNDAIRLTRLINDLLDLERMKSGHVEMNWEEVSINELMRDIVARTLIGSLWQGQIALELDEEIPLIQADSDKLTQVITNLISNAIKYSPEGGAILIGSKWESGNVHFFVQDHGIGVPAEKMEQIFERYARVESTATRYIGGTGLGLPIVRQIVEMHHGSVWVESELGEGSTFHVVMPAHPLLAAKGNIG